MSLAIVSHQVRFDVVLDVADDVLFNAVKDGKEGIEISCLTISS